MLNNEKITPYFLNLVKGTKNEDPISSITNDDETSFDSDDERNNFIKNTFEKLYAIPEDELLLNNGCIENFLGPVNEHPIVIGSKLNEEEKDSMETPLTIEELDQSINQAKLKSETGCQWFLKLLYKGILAYFSHTSPQTFHGLLREKQTHKIL